MGNIHEYYQKLSEDILTYIKEKQYEKALEIIDMELEQPYTLCEFIKFKTRYWKHDEWKHLWKWNQWFK